MECFKIYLEILVTPKLHFNLIVILRSSIIGRFIVIKAAKIVGSQMDNP